MRRSISVWLLVFAFGATAAVAEPAEGLRLEGVSVQLFLEKSGAFSRDITALSDFHSWNFVPSGSGIPDGERFDGVLIKVALHSPKEVFAKGRQGTISLVSAETGKTVETMAINDVYLGPGLAYRAFYVAHVACKPLVLKAAIGSTIIRKELPFRCGE